MIFSSPVFLYIFLPLLALIYSLSRRKNAVLLFASLFFYAWGEPIFVLLMVAVATINYLFGELVYRDSPYRFRYLAIAVTINIAILIGFKYLSFIVENINLLIPAESFHALPVPHPSLPLGISFFIFQSVTYVVDIYRRDSAPARSFADALLYISLFPQLVAGPIVRYNEIADRIQSRRSDWNRVISGVELFAVGLAKKVLLADSLSGTVDQIFSMPSQALGMGMAWLGVICFALQIFFDFSGYSDMAIGIGRALGFNFPENFNQPYRSRSIQEFWRRWHMTLSRWFRDYVYIPLGGNRLGIARTYINLLGVFALTGFWHGASWNFLIWGLIHGLFLIFERLGLGSWLQRAWAPVGHIYVICVVLLGWVFFRADDLTSAFAFLGAMVGLTQVPIVSGMTDLASPYMMGVVLLGIIMATLPERDSWESKDTRHVWKSVLLYSTLSITTLFSLVLITAYSHKAFIYFRF